MQKLKTAFCMVLCMAVLTACGSGIDAEETAVMIDKKGGVKGVIVEEFSADYYGKDDLEQFTKQEVAAYNSGRESAAVTLSKIEVRDGIVKAVMEYASAKDYSEFNKKAFFVGTVQEAYEQGYDLDVTLKSAADPQKTISKSEILTMGNKMIVIAEENILYMLPSKALYISTGEEAVKSDAVRKADGSVQGNLYIIY